MNNDPVGSFGQTAQGLARNPLGIIALFIVLVYGLAALVTLFSSSLASYERLPLIWFLVIFPVLVLGVFTWLVSRHSVALFAPSDFKNEDNYVRVQMTAAASVTAATVAVATGSKSDASISEVDIPRIVDAVRQASLAKSSGTESWRNQLLWVDDRPDNNIYERRAFQAVGLQITLATATNQALDLLKHHQYAAIISDMGRREGPNEGYVLLDAIRQKGNPTPFFIYAGSNLPEHQRETVARGGQGTTNNPQDLFQMVMSAIVTRS